MSDVRVIPASEAQQAQYEAAREFVALASTRGMAVSRAQGERWWPLLARPSLPVEGGPEAIVYDRSRWVKELFA